MKIESVPFFSTGGLPALGMLGDYARDSWQRIVLYADVMRRRGNQYQEHLAEEVPNVLDFPAELVMSGKAHDPSQIPLEGDSKDF